MSTCGYLLPGYYGHIAGGYPPEHPECFLRDKHQGSHLCLFSDETIIEWESDMSGECGCSPFEMEAGECDCFTYAEVSVAEAIERLKKDGPRA